MRLGRKGADTGQRPLTWRADQLEEALAVGGSELDPEPVAAATDLVDKVRQRWAIKGGRTVVALAGATGSGKSSLFNALVGEEVSTIGARRPTTATATAAVWGPEPAEELLEWLGIHRRHQVRTGAPAGTADPLDGLVLIDLPDFDSREVAHRVEADRVLGRADVFVWVTDPQKYADARLHEDYLRPLQDHEAVMLVVLNQVDRIPSPEAVEQLKADLARLVAADGAGEFEVIGTSARLQQGLDDLRGEIGEVVGARTAAEQRLVGDLRGTARELRAGVADTEPARGKDEDAALVDALKRSAGVPVVLEAVRKDYLRQAGSRAGWPFTRWIGALRPDPLRRLRLGDDRAGGAGISPSDVRTVLGRSSLPAPSPAARSGVALATRRVGEAAGASLPPRWAEAVAQAATPGDGALADALDQAVMGTPLRARNPAWWSVLGFLQLLLAACAVVGLLWLALLAVLGWLQVPMEAPTWGPVPIPLLLLGGGLVLGLVLAALAKVLARSGARHRRAVVDGRLTEAVRGVATEHVRRPVEAVLERHRRTRQHLDAVLS
ncbi:GTPase [Ornithinicoccus hortensis]|uniref:50S ribosome-binding GTPase n=1 Tax=Ornithinicoccus hortensis TaxID=82346 RepID=A0A542YUG6_9MICO|nr:GTPase [Ornithinicoccus hortensis]TQL51721.1 50S ribosome-binding GTPase [Ornithinicoccus hortensis]